MYFQRLSWPGSGVDRAWTEFLLQSSEDAGHRDWQNVRKNNLQKKAKEPQKPTTTAVEILWLPMQFIQSLRGAVKATAMTQNWLAHQTTSCIANFLKISLYLHPKDNMHKHLRK